ncbi:hypothetical protein [Embleya sp. NBC_00896]|uniref:hypothetical protein n=1 Tax=Embleya sp. NBC_00896 TaxID=2975961 RepID=UPI00387053AC|nr:hypothetical protein OG928_03645 [Embleya sp. NBC_00896]
MRGTGRITRLVAAFAILIVPAAAQVTATAPAAYAVDTAKGTPGFCPTANGVTVIVDFQELGGTTIVRCAPGDQATGHAALKNAGINIAGTSRWGEAFICRIEGKPGPNSEPCIDTPPAKAYWSYWHAPNNGSWTYSQWGVMNRKPPLGSFEGWSFSKDKTETTNPPPRVAPLRPAAPPVHTPDPPKANDPQPDQNTSRGAQGTTGSANGGATTGGTNSGGTSSGGTTTGSGTTGGTTAAGGSTGDTSANADPLAPGPGVSGNPMESQPAEPPPAAPAETAAGPAPDPAAAGPTAAGRPSGVTPQGQTWTGGEELANAENRSGVPITTIGGVCLLVAFAAAAGFTAWRRRSTDGTT